MAKLYDVVVVTGEYTDSNGAKKNRYLTIGAVIEGKNGPCLKLEAVPVGWNGWGYLNEPREQQQQKPQQRQARAPMDGGDDIPF